MKYKVSHGGQELAPLALPEIVQKIRNKEIELFDYIFDETKNDWVLLLEHAEVATALKSNKPARPPGGETTVEKPAKSTAKTVETTPTAKAGEWFVLKGEHRFGPFGHDEVVRMLQQKVVFPFDFIWNADMSDWQRVAEVRAFNTEHIRELFEKSGKKAGVFVERQHKRRKHSTRVIIHDNVSLWKGESFEISKGGMGVTLTNALVVPGQQVFVHFSGGEGLPAFTAVCEVVSKKFVADSSPVEYGLRFLSMNPDVQSEFNKKVN